MKWSSSQPRPGGSDPHDAHQNDPAPLASNPELTIHPDQPLPPGRDAVTSENRQARSVSVRTLDNAILLLKRLR